MTKNFVFLTEQRAKEVLSRSSGLSDPTLPCVGDEFLLCTGAKLGKVPSSWDIDTKGRPYYIKGYHHKGHDVAPFVCG